jgi:hypothetical protein
MCVSFCGNESEFLSASEYKRRDRLRFHEKACAMMAARETKSHFALPDAALPPIHSPEKIVVRGSFGRFDRMYLCCCERTRGGRLGRAADEQRGIVAPGVE